MEIVETLKQLIAETTGIDSGTVQLESHIEQDLNISKIERAEFLNYLEDHFKIDLHSEEVANIETVSDLKNLIEDHLNEI
jgi:acyl carrier protein